MNINIEWLNTPTKEINHDCVEYAKKRQSTLTKPAGSLGQLENLAIRLSGMQATETPTVSKVHCSVFAADHGIATEGVSAFPQVVTGEMIRNFASGGAAISVLTKNIGATLEVINLGTINPLEEIKNVKTCNIGQGTKNFLNEPAMSEEQLSRAIHVGRQTVERAKLNDCQLFIGGEMGIGNTTSATAIACALLKISPELLAGPGTGLNSEGIKHKAHIISQALAKHNDKMITPLDILRRLGGFEIAALVGAYITSAQIGIPAVVDGYITTVAALLACEISPDTKHWLIFSHASAEPGHKTLLSSLHVEAVLNLGMRLGEGSGAATCVPLLQIACQLHNQMASFAEANVSES